MSREREFVGAVSVVALTLGLAGATRLEAQEAFRKLKVCATVPELGQLSSEVGGDEVTVFVFAKAQQDPHFLEAKLSFIKELSTADALVHVGLELEVAWEPNLWQNARNPQVLPGAIGFIDASKAIAPLNIPGGVVDRSLGDVHAFGNPHYLSDPICGLQVARLLSDSLQKLRPQKADYFKSRCADFERRLGSALVGEKLAAKYDVEKLSILHEHGKLEEFLRKQEDGAVGGWLGRLASYRGAQVASDHDLWPYFARRFGLKIIAFLEPRPGIPPSTRHLREVIAILKANRVRAVLTVSYFDSRHARLVSEETGARIVSLAHQCGAQPGTDRYLDMVEFNVTQLENVLGGTRG